MIPRFSLLLLGLFIGCQGHEICTFKHHLCKWYQLYDCHFRHEMKKDLQGETGYLYLSKNTCKRAGIYFYTTHWYHRFQLHYFINGTGYGTIAAYANYFWSGRNLLWSCNLNYGPQWNKADIFVADVSP